MVLFDDIVEILDLTNLDRCVPVIIDPIYSSFIGPTFVHRDLLRITIMAHRFFEEPLGCCFIALCRQKKVDGFTFLINGTIEILPNTFHLNIRLVHSPTPTNWTFVLAENFFK